MDLRTVMTISTLLFMTAEQTTLVSNSTGPSLTTMTTNTSENCSCPCAAQAATTAPTVTPSSSALALGLLTIRWTSDCKGEVVLDRPSSSSSPVCHESEKNVQSHLRSVCQSRKGCKGTPSWDKGGNTPNGYHIEESGAVEVPNCHMLRVKCAVEEVADVQGQLRTYKVVIALLCCMLLVLLLIRFTRPTVKALQKRLSDRRQNRWVGPTQSHSVSYQRGKTAIKNNDEEKRLSYPALERLAVSDSREPSSNRNSDYNF